MTNTVTLPDGSVHNFPDEATPEMMAQALGVSVGQPEQSFTQRVSNDYSQRVSNAQDLANQGVSGKQTMAETIPEMGAQLVAGPINDVVKEAITSAAPYVQKAASYLPGMDSYNQGVNTITNAVAPAAKYVGEKYGQAEQSFPRVTNALNALATTAQAAGTVVPAMGVASKIGFDTGGAIPTSEQVFGEASKAYKAADASGASLKPDATNAFIKQANLDAGQNAASLKMSGADDVTRLLNGNGKDTGINSFLDQPLTLQDAHAMDKDLGDAITSNLRSGNDAIANRLGKVQAALRDNLMNPAAENINGGADGFQAWKEGNRLWSQASRMQDAEAIQKNAVGADVPATAIKNGAKALLKKVNASGGRGWTDEQIAALTTASQTGVISGAMKLMGSRLGAITAGAVGAGAGAAIGGIPGAIMGGIAGNATGNLVGAPFRYGAEALQSGRVNNVLRSIVDNPKFTPSAAAGEATGAENIKPNAPLQIANRGAVMTADSEGNISRTPNPANEVVNTQPRPITPQNTPPAYQPTPNPLMKLLPSPNSARPMSDAEIAQSRELLKNGSPKTGGVPVGNPEGNPVPNAQSTVRNPNDGLLDKAIKEPIGTAAQNEGYQNLTWIKQRQIDKLIPQYTSNTLTKAQVIRQMSQIGLSPQDADKIISSAYQSKIWRNSQLANPLQDLTKKR